MAGLVIAAVAVREGVEAWRGEGCCAPARSDAADDDCGCAESCCAQPTGPVVEISARPKP
jgi:hypothetical protein